MPRYTKQEVIQAVRESSSIRQTLMKIGLAPKGGNYATFYRLKEKYNLDTSHFGTRTQGLVAYEKTPIDQVLVKESTMSGTYLKKRLLEEGFKEYKCENCDRSTWEGAPIPLELHHINGVSMDNRWDNLQLLCPNCHAFTDNYRGKNITKT